MKWWINQYYRISQRIIKDFALDFEQIYWSKTENCKKKRLGQNKKMIKNERSDEIICKKLKRLCYD